MFVSVLIDRGDQPESRDDIARDRIVLNTEFITLFLLAEDYAKIKLYGETGLAIVSHPESLELLRNLANPHWTAAE